MSTIYAETFAVFFFFPHLKAFYCFVHVSTCDFSFKVFHHKIRLPILWSHRLALGFRVLYINAKRNGYQYIIIIIHDVIYAK